MYPDNSTAQVMHCRCPRNSVAYLVKRQAYQTDAGLGYQFSFACSPQTVSFFLSLSQSRSSLLCYFSSFFAWLPQTMSGDRILLEMTETTIVIPAFLTSTSHSQHTQINSQHIGHSLFTRKTAFQNLCTQTKLQLI